MPCTEHSCPHHGEANRKAAGDATRERRRKAIEESVTLWDHFSATINLRIAELQPQYGLVQLNARREKCGSMISCDIKRDEFLAAVASVLKVRIFTDEELAAYVDLSTNPVRHAEAGSSPGAVRDERHVLVAPLFRTAAVYTCTCGGWTGLPGHHGAHVAAVLDGAA